MTKRNRTLLPLLAAATSVVLAACGSGSDASSGKRSEASGAETGGTDTVTVGVIPVVSNAAIHLGQQKGFFEEEGITLEIEPTIGGAAAVPAVLAGDYDFADSNVVSLFVAAAQGIDLELVAPGASTLGDTSRDTSAVVVLDDSPISRPSDLEGKTVAANTLGNIGDVTISAVVEEDGGDASAVDFVEIAFPDMGAALESGDVDAAWMVDPFLTLALEGGARVVTYNYPDFDPKLPIEAYFTTSKFAQQNPELVDRFVRALIKSNEYANENPDEVREVVSTFTEISEELLSKIAPIYYPTEFDVKSLQKLADATQKYGSIDDPVDVMELIAD